MYNWDKKPRIILEKKVSFWDYGEAINILYRHAVTEKNVFVFQGSAFLFVELSQHKCLEVL